MCYFVKELIGGVLEMKKDEKNKKDLQKGKWRSPGVM